MRHWIAAALALAAAGGAPQAAAQALDWHVGVGATGELAERGPHDFDADGENGYTLLAGARWDTGFGVEAAYVDLGRLTASAILDAGFDIEGELWSVGATYGVRLDRFEPYAKLGWFSREEDGILIGIAGPTPIDLSDDGLMAEVGARVHLGESFALRAGYAHYDFERGGEGSVQLLAEFHF
jgi:hypothetical protein